MQPGVYPASVTPFDAKGRVDMVSVARLLAWFEAGGCAGAVLAGTNGEGPSLGLVEKRDLLRQAMPLRGRLDLVLGIATSSLDEAHWLCKQAYSTGAAAVLLMPPSYFKEASEDGLLRWFEEVIADSPVPVLVYNFPQRTGVHIRPEFLERLARLDNFAGAKDSSGDRENLASYKAAAGDRSLFVGNETLLIEALGAGWSGTISGAGNALPMWLSQIVAEWVGGNKAGAETKFQLLLPAIEALRNSPQPSVNKELLRRKGILSEADVRLPLLAAEPSAANAAAAVIRDAVGIAFGERRDR